MELYGLFPLDFVGNVPRDFGRTDDLPRLVAHGRYGKRNRYFFPRFSNTDGLVVIYRPASPDFADDGMLFMLEVSWNNRIYRFTHNFIFVVAENPLRTVVPAHHDAIEVLTYNRIVR